MERWKSLLVEARDAAAVAKSVAEKVDAAQRDWTEDERTEYRKAFDLATQRKAQADAAKADSAVLIEAKGLADSLGLNVDIGEDVRAQGDAILARHGKGKSLGRQVVESAQYKAMLASFGGRIPEKARVQSDPIPFETLIAGAKALWTGGGDTSGGAFVTTERSDIVEVLGRKPLTIRDLVSVRRTTSDTIEYVRQTAHTNAAAIVAEATSSAAPTAPEAAGALVLDAGGGYKPEGSWAYEVASTTVKTIAEWVPATKRALADVAQLEGLINDELLADLAETEEAQILNGNGTGQNITGILNTSGIQTQAKGSDTIFDAVFKAITKARITGRVAPTAVVLNPAEEEKVALAKDSQGRYFGNGPFSQGPNTLWGLPRVVSESQPAGTGLVGDFGKAVLWDREQASVTATDSHADFFIRNMVAILAEERVGFAVPRPSAFVTVTGL